MTIKVQRLSKRFSSFEALRHIDFSIEKGEFIAILGPSGCGKTTLLRLLAGFLSPTEGTITIGDQEVGNPTKTLPPEKRNIGMVFQSFALWPHLNVAEHIRFPLQHHRFVSEEIKQNQKKRMEDVLKIVELESFRTRMPSELSGGQKQRVALARAIAPKPELLLMDEPLSNLDAELRMEMRSEIQSLHRLTNATILYVTHDQSEALAMADRIIVMNNGQIEQIDTPTEIYHHPRTPFVAKFVGKANLMKGKWTKDRFTPDLIPSIQWPDIGIEPDMKQLGYYPIRPEQLILTKEQSSNQAVPAVITSIQFQGKEMHYNVQVLGGEEWQIQTGLGGDPFDLGEQVFLEIKQEVLLSSTPTHMHYVY
ncbi:ATP-binding cassette domain-containing protein [Gracilibacillus sp. JCM 18860]|uniref:ATP-binding cassette domain-containing protein n=1 Tax=Gracilibacillus sp. JCM 18860 TaxID=1306159 RepID=UPI0006D0ABAA